MARFRQAIGAELRQIRHLKGLRLVDVSTAAHVSITHISEVENGHREASWDTLEAICEALGVFPVVSFHLLKVPSRSLWAGIGG